MKKLPKLKAAEWSSPERRAEAFAVAIENVHAGLAAESDKEAAKAYKTLGPLLQRSLELEFLHFLPPDIKDAWEEPFHKLHVRVIGFAPGHAPTTDEFDALFPADRRDDVRAVANEFGDMLEAMDGATPKQVANGLRRAAKSMGIKLSNNEAMRMAAAWERVPVPPL